MSHMKSYAVGHAAKEYVKGDNIPPEGPGPEGTGGPADGTDLMHFGMESNNGGPHKSGPAKVSRFFGEGVEE